MNRQDIKKILHDLTPEIDQITDKKAVTIIKVLINLVEMLAEENARLRETNQELRDEMNRLKGEQGKPNIRKQKERDQADHSSDMEGKKRECKKNRKPKNKKTQTVRIDRQVIVEFDKTALPNNVIFKGFERRIIQDLKIITDHVEFKLPTYYSPSLKKTFIASLPKAYQESEFGPGVRTLAITLYRDSGMTVRAIERFFQTFGISISRSTVSCMITENHDVFHHEKEEIINAGLQVSRYQHIDDTTCRVNGQNGYTHILCNPYFTAYFTRAHKDRLTLLELLCRSELQFLLNRDAYRLMAELGLSPKWLEHIQPLLREAALTRSEIDMYLEQFFPKPKKHSTNRRIILEACALVYYRQSEYAIQYLICDDAPQFNKIAAHHVLCWIHEGRHYKKLIPLSVIHQRLVDIFIDTFWDYYDALLRYKKNPTEAMARTLSTQFDILFATQTCYDALDRRIALTAAKKEHLLLVLAHPFLPLHNNSAELGARVQARIRDIHLQTISENGTNQKILLLP